MRNRRILDRHDLLALHQLDKLDFKERDVVVADFQRAGKLQIHGRKGGIGLFLLLFPLFIDNSLCSGFGETGKGGFNLLIDNDGSGRVRTRTANRD